MRRLILVLVLLMAIAVGGYALLGGQKSGEKVSVLFAASNIPSGRFISQDSIEVRQVSVDEQRRLVKKFGALCSPDLLKELQNFVPRVGIRKDEAIAENLLIRPTDPDFLPAVLTQGHRAVTVQLNDVTTGIGLYRPGNYVDLILTYTDTRSKIPQKQGKVAVTLFRGLRILALGGDLGLGLAKPAANDGKAQKKTNSAVTLEATPRQAESIVLASKLGELSLSLRANDGQDDVTGPTSTYASDVMQTNAKNSTRKKGQRPEVQEPIKVRGLYGDQQKTITLE